ncbi:MAG: response regulator transcription factor [Tepidisphaerales bacterium]
MGKAVLPSGERIRILVVDDDNNFRDRLVRAFAMRGLDAHGAHDAAEAMVKARQVRPHRAVVDMRMPGKTGIELVKDLTAFDPNIQVVVLTGYGSIATAVEAVRNGAIDYLNKPVDTDQILAVFDRDEHDHAAAGKEAVEQTPSLARVEWEHIQRILLDCGGNISQAARKLGIHRRSLQRKLSKLPPWM